MFKNIGKKIKTLAKVLCIIEIALCVIVGAACIIIGIIGEFEFLGGQYILVTGIISGIAILILGPLAAWIGSFLLYGFGELIDKTCAINEKLDNEKIEAAQI